MKKKLNIFIVAIATAAMLLSFQNCGQQNLKSLESLSQGSLASPINGTVPNSSALWTINTPISFVEGSGDTIDLTKTLPSGTKPNGRFYVDTTSGPDLPAGMSLSSSGILSVGTASVAEVSGVVFAYDEP